MEVPLVFDLMNNINIVINKCQKIIIYIESMDDVNNVLNEGQAKPSTR